MSINLALIQLRSSQKHISIRSVGFPDRHRRSTTSTVYTSSRPLSLWAQQIFRWMTTFRFSSFVKVWERFTLLFSSFQNKSVSSLNVLTLRRLCQSVLIQCHFRRRKKKKLRPQPQTNWPSSVGSNYPIFKEGKYKSNAVLLFELFRPPSNIWKQSWHQFSQLGKNFLLRADNDKT